MRLFVAVYPSDEAISAWRRFQSTAPRWPLRWTPESSLHFTLKFLGQTDPSLEPKINEILQRTAQLVSPFSLSLSGGGVFPPKGKPTVFWAGPQEQTNMLEELAQMLDLELKTIGFAVEKRSYQAHMTVAKLSDRNMKVDRTLSEDFTHWIRAFTSDTFQVAQLCLVESRLGSTGSTYFVRQTFPFAG